MTDDLMKIEKMLNEFGEAAEGKSCGIVMLASLKIAEFCAERIMEECRIIPEDLVKLSLHLECKTDIAALLKTFMSRTSN